MELQADVDFALAGEAGFLGPQSGKCMTNIPHSVLNHSESYWTNAMGNVPSLVSLGKLFEDGHRIPVQY